MFVERSVLVERSEVLDGLDDLLSTSAAAGRGFVAAVTGSIAMGKTAVLGTLADRAAQAGSTVLSVASTSYERDHQFSGLTQLLQGQDLPAPAVHAGTGHPGRGSEEVTDPRSTSLSQESLVAAAQHTHRVVAELAGRSHLLITVDDVEHTDEATLFCLRHLARRLLRLPVTLVLARGTLLPEGQGSPLLDDLVHQADVHRFHLGPLTPAGVRELAARLAAPTDSPGWADLAADLHHLSSGNPLLVRALVDDYRTGSSATAAPSWGEGPTSPDCGPAAGHYFQQTVLTCVHRLGPHALGVARGAALLGDEATQLLLSRLCGMDTELVRRCLRLLTDIGVLDGTRLRIPEMRQALLRELPHEEVTRLRHRAATMLHKHGAAPRSVAELLLNSAPLHEDWVAPVLREASGDALEDGDAAFGLRCLEQARECCTEEARPSLMARYAAGQWQLRPADSPQHYLALKSSIGAGRLTPGEALRAAEGMMFYLHLDEALAVVNQYDGGDECTLQLLHSTQLLMASEFIGLQDRTARPLPKARLTAVSTYEVRARYALARVLEHGTDEDTIALAEQVLRGTRSEVRWRAAALPPALLALCYADRLESAGAWYEILSADSRISSTPAWQGLLDGVGAMISLRRGRLSEAVRLAEAARELLIGRCWNVGSASALAVLVEARTAMGDHEAVAELLASEPPQQLFVSRSGLHFLYARGRHHLATGKLSMALTDFLGCGTMMQRWNVDTPTLAPWRLGAAEAWGRLGDQERASLLVEKELAAPDTGLVRARGMALHSLARLRPVEKQPPLLLDAFARLESAGAWYEAAGVLVDLTHAYQQSGETAVARQTARRAWRLARSCQAESLCQALLPSSTRGTEAMMPRGTESGQGGFGEAVHGGGLDFAELSESERRVAILATQGCSNREIADRLFITVSTVEQHLTRVYRKLGVRNREQLLEGADAARRQPA